MSTFALSSSDLQLYALVTGPVPPIIPDVVARMQANDAILPANNGLKWFNQA